jgi:hypothetical protein
VGQGVLHVRCQGGGNCTGHSTLTGRSVADSVA